MEAPDPKWQHFWDLHVMAAVRLSRAMVPLMRRRGGGVILNTASIYAKPPLGYEPIYNTTKAALVMFSKCLANEPGERGQPLLILTPDWKKTAGQLTAGTSTTVDQYLDKIAKDNAPIGRFATPEELAHVYEATRALRTERQVSLFGHSVLWSCRDGQLDIRGMICVIEKPKLWCRFQDGRIEIARISKSNRNTDPAALGELIRCGKQIEHQFEGLPSDDRLYVFPGVAMPR
jgi:hypothetical protein